MIRTLRLLFLIVCTGLTSSSFAQEIYGTILDATRQPLPSAVVIVTQGGQVRGGGPTDFDGNYTIKPLDAGHYTVRVTYTGLDTQIVNDVIVGSDKRTRLDFSMTVKDKSLVEVVVHEYKNKIVDIDNTGGYALDKKEIDKIPTTEVNDMLATNSQYIQARRGDAGNVGGARSTGVLYIIDGVQVQGTVGTNLSQGSIDELEITSSGISAKYGDVSGAVVNITTRGVSQKYAGDVRVQHSIDGYNNNLASFSLSGPIYKKKIDSVTRKPVLGFSLSGDIYDDHDRYPSYDNQFVTKGSVLKNLLANPLKVVSDNSGTPVYNLASEYITLKDLQQVQQPPNNEIQEQRLNGKVDYEIADNLHLTAGGMYDNTNSDAYSRSRNLFAPDATPVDKTTVGRGFIRLTQKFGKSANDTGRHVISNAFYTIQADYQKTYQGQQDPNFKHNIFDYAYVGKFNNTSSVFYNPHSVDSASGRTGTILQGDFTTGITYDRSNLNPNLANYTSQLLNSENVVYSQLSQIQARNGIVNGDEPSLTYPLTIGGTSTGFLSPGATQSNFSYFNSDQYSFSVDASFDLLLGSTKHAIGFGLYYQQRIERSFSASANYYGVGTLSLWSLMRSLVSSYDNGKIKVDKEHPIFIVGGQKYNYIATSPTTGYFTDANGNQKNISPSPTDTVIYNYVNTSSSAFDQNLRKQLKLGPTDNINIDAYAPSTYSLGLFSADELLNSGNPFTSYYGYTYTGGTQTGTVNFNDFWTAKDKNGDYTRPIGAFSPNYIAGYILDKFDYKNLHFNVGVRVDRYSANTKVLKDPYSEYPEITVANAGARGAVGTIPGNIGKDYVVYVSDNTSAAPSIVGFRNGDSWYDATGKYIEDPHAINNAIGHAPQPLMPSGTKSISDTAFNPNGSFTDYTPQVTVMPRIQFSFPINEDANLFAHYDIYAQRPYPTALGVATAYDYYFLQNNLATIISNANLKPEKTFDYEVGFQQKLSSSSGLTISAFYKERKDQIAVVPYIDAYPVTYFTYGNRDFSTTKGTTMKYDLRATNHLQLTLSYTLQFAEGTGSTPYSSNSGSGAQITPNGLLQSFINAGLPNLRYVSALDYDSRHNVVANIDYSFAQDEGPSIAGRKVFQNASIDIVAKARSGEPYTRVSDLLGNTVVGGLNGSRLPWHYGMDLRLSKDFALSFAKRNVAASEGVKVKKPQFLKAFVYFQNLLNTRDILGVYGYTGRADDNGYLTSSYGQQFVPQQINPQSFTDLYRININNPGNYNYARTINFGLEYNF